MYTDCQIVINIQLSVNTREVMDHRFVVYLSFPYTSYIIIRIKFLCNFPLTKEST